MRYRILALLLAVATMAGSVQAQAVKLRGKIKGFDHYPVGIVVNDAQENKLTPIDTIYTNGRGAFRAVLEVKHPTLYVLTFTAMKQSSIIHFMAMPGEKVTLDMEYKTEDRFVVITRVGGSDNMSAYQQFNTAMYRPMREARAVAAEFADSNTTEARKQTLQENYQRIFQQQRRDVRKVVAGNKDRLISALLVTYFDDDFATYADLYGEVRDALIERYPSNTFVQHLDQRVKSSMATGTLAPDISMKNADGQTLNLSDLRGKVVLLDFWASWCRPCRMANPEVVRLYEKYKADGFEVFSVSLDNDRAAWQKAIAADGLAWPNHVSDLKGWKSSGAAAYGVVSIPSTVLIDKQGRIIAKDLRGEELARKLQDIFAH